MFRVSEDLKREFAQSDVPNVVCTNTIITGVNLNKVMLMQAIKSWSSERSITGPPVNGSDKQGIRLEGTREEGRESACH